MKKVFNRVKNNKKLRIIGISILVLFAALITRITFAFFAPDINSGFANVNAGNDTVDALKFEVGDPLSFNVNSSTLPESGVNLVKNTTAKAILRANSTNNEASYDYYLYLELTDNTFVYSDGSTPEIILSVTDPNGNPVTSVNGLNYGTFSGVEGFDVTTANGIYLLGNSIITSSSSTTDTISEWQISLTYLNLPIDQSINYGHSMTTKLMMQKDKLDNKLASYIKRLYTTQGANNLYHHDGTLENGINDNSYRYAGSFETTNNWVCFGKDDATGAYAEGWCDDEHLYRIIGVFDSVVIGEEGNPTGASEPRVKLIKAYEGTESSLGTAPNGNGTKNTTYYKGKLDTIPGYNRFGSDDWSTNSLNINILNGTYLTKINEDGNNWTDKIAITEWKIGGNEYDYISNVKTSITYEKEVLHTYNGQKVNKKIGLMYVSDYGFAASQANWNTTLYNYNNNANRDNNWLFMGIYEWTISPLANASNSAFLVYDNGNVSSISLNARNGIRPTFYLNKNVEFVGGTGTSTDPYRIA